MWRVELYGRGGPRKCLQEGSVNIKDVPAWDPTPLLTELGISSGYYQLYFCWPDISTLKFQSTVSAPWHLCFSITLADPVSNSRGAQMEAVQETTFIISGSSYKYMTITFTLNITTPIIAGVYFLLNLAWVVRYCDTCIQIRSKEIIKIEWGCRKQCVGEV